MRKIGKNEKESDGRFKKYFFLFFMQILEFLKNSLPAVLEDMYYRRLSSRTAGSEAYYRRFKTGRGFRRWNTTDVSLPTVQKNAGSRGSGTVGNG